MLDFKQLFSHLADLGAGREVDENGFPQGPWTPELLANAISLIDANHTGVDLRTVQFWFQDNDKGISAENVRWLARIFGCDDPQATSLWQAELSASKTRLIAKRRLARQPEVTPLAISAEAGGAEASAVDPPPAPITGISIARRSEAIFGSTSYLDLPASIFAGAVALGFMSVFLGVHSVIYDNEAGLPKQVGFLWAPNWTFLFLVFMPLFLSSVVAILNYWKIQGRPSIIAVSNHNQSNKGWIQKVEQSSYTFGAVFLICIGFAGIFQWVEVRLRPLLTGEAGHAPDWGSIALTRPDIISIGQEAFFTGAAYLYMCVCFYIFFVALILLYTLTYDLWHIDQTSGIEDNSNYIKERRRVTDKVMRGVFQCVILGLIVAICMRLQSSYLITDSKNVPTWLINDAKMVIFGAGNAVRTTDHISPTHFTSLIVALATTVVFAYSSIRLRYIVGYGGLIAKMTACVAFLIATYLLVGAFTGFSFMLLGSVIIGLCAYLDPGLGTKETTTDMENSDVS